jgi:uncharacterized small protein (DUF1192 family)
LDLIDITGPAVNDQRMDFDEILAKNPDDPLAQLARQDLERLSLEELDRRIVLLEAEAARSRQQIERATKQRAQADDLFRK